MLLPGSMKQSPFLACFHQSLLSEVLGWQWKTPPKAFRGVTFQGILPPTRPCEVSPTLAVPLHTSQLSSLHLKGQKSPVRVQKPLLPVESHQRAGILPSTIPFLSNIS